MREVWDGSLSYLFVGIGFVVVGLPSIKCVEPTLESWQGVQILFPDCLFTFLIQTNRPCGSLRSVGIAISFNGERHHC
jgi:hypothetical protein